MKRTAWNIVIDTLSLVVFMFMISTGLLLKYVLPPGSGRMEMVLKGSHGHQTIDLFIGLTRHQWGEIHFYIALTFLAVLIIHLALHWNWIKAMTFGTKTNPQSKKRKIITICIVFFIILTLAFPWIVQKKTYSKSEFQELKGDVTWKER